MGAQHVADCCVRKKPPNPNVTCAECRAVVPKSHVHVTARIGDVQLGELEVSKGPQVLGPARSGYMPGCRLKGPQEQGRLKPEPPLGVALRSQLFVFQRG